MRLRSWQVPDLPRVECYLPLHLPMRVRLHHVETHVHPEPLADGRRVGDTVWEEVFDGRRLMVAWDWLEIMPGVVCQLDPANVSTNIRFLNPRGCYEEPAQAMISVNKLVHRTPWQYVVISALRGRQQEELALRSGAGASARQLPPPEQRAA
jgi:hypothetical protein